MDAILFALLAFFGWSTGDIFGGLVARKVGSYSSAVLNYIICIILASLYIPFALPELRNFNFESAIWLIILLPIGIIPLTTLYEGMNRGNASLVGTVAGSFGALVAVLSVIFLRESLNFLQVISILVVVIGLILSSIDLKNLKLKQVLTDKGIPFALISLLAWAIYFTFIKIPIRQIGWFWPAYISWWGFPIILFYLKSKSIKISIPKDNKHRSYVLLNAIMSVLGLFSFNFAASVGQISIVAPIASSYPALFALLAYFVFKDKLSRQQIIGMLITLIGVISLSFLA